MIKSGLKIETFLYSKSKSEIDEIDMILAKFYNFSNEELDFIINYDIKYRMGKELDAYIESVIGKESMANKE